MVKIPGIVQSIATRVKLQTGHQISNVLHVEGPHRRKGQSRGKKLSIMMLTIMTVILAGSGIMSLSAGSF